MVMAGNELIGLKYNAPCFVFWTLTVFVVIITLS